MVAVIKIPTQLKPLTGGFAEVQRVGTTVAGLISELEKSYPGFAPRLLDDTGRVRRFCQHLR